MYDMHDEMARVKVYLSNMYLIIYELINGIRNVGMELIKRL